MNIFDHLSYSRRNETAARLNLNIQNVSTWASHCVLSLYGKHTSQAILFLHVVPQIKLHHCITAMFMKQLIWNCRLVMKFACKSDKSYCILCDGYYVITTWWVLAVCHSASFGRHEFDDFPSCHSISV